MTEAILLTGGAGFIGSHLAAALLKKGLHVDIVDNLSTGKLENIPDGAQFLELDLRFENGIKELPRKKYSAVLHLAGQSSGEKSFEDPVYDLDANARSTLLLSDWARKTGIGAFIYASSMGVYGQCEQQPVHESTEASPISYYGASKLGAERILSVAASQGLRTVCFRMFNVYGPGQNLQDMKQGMVSIYLAQLLREKSLVVKGALDRIRDFIYIDDVISAWILALEKPVQGIFNLGTGVGTQVGSLIAMLLKACDLDPDFPVQQTSGTPGDQFAMSADINAISSALGWTPKTTLEEGITRIVNWALSMEKK
jgi:UDP-glucose 4-epimerase